MNKLLSLKSFGSLALVLACFALASISQAVPPPRGENRGNGNSAAEEVDALNEKNTGANNTTHGWFSLTSNTEGRDNTADGFQALQSNTDGVSNTAAGSQALLSNTSGSFNTAVGRLALSTSTLGNFNTALGQLTLWNNTADANTAVGYLALSNNTTGRLNTALGYSAGLNVTDAVNVTCIGNSVLGANVSSTTWIGNVYGVITQNATTAPVVVSADGQLGTVASSQRFKKDIGNMEKTSEAILALRPVTFHYKNDVKETPQFGLIAEEVAKINPALVLPDQQGEPYTVRYDVVNAMLLNEFLKEHRKVEEQQVRIDELDCKMAKQDVVIAQQQKGMEILALQLQQHDAQIQTVNAQLETIRPAPQMAVNP